MRGRGQLISCRLRWEFLSLCAQTLPRSGRPLGDNAKYTLNCPHNLGSRMSYLNGWRGEALWLRHSSLISEWGTGAGGPRGAPSCWEEECWERKRERERARQVSALLLCLSYLLSFGFCPSFHLFYSGLLFSGLLVAFFHQQGGIMCVSINVFKATS